MIENAKQYGEFKQENDFLIERFKELSSLKKEVKINFLEELFERLKRYFVTVEFTINDRDINGFIAVYKGISYEVFIENEVLFIKLDEKNFNSFNVMPGSRSPVPIEIVFSNDYLAKEMSKLYDDNHKLKEEIKSLEQEEFSYWSIEYGKEFGDTEDVLKFFFD